MNPLSRMFPARAGSAAIARRLPSASDDQHPLDYTLVAPPADEDSTMQRHQEPTE